MVVVIMVVVMVLMKMMVFMSLNHQTLTIHIPSMLSLYPLSHLLHGKVMVLLSMPMPPVIVRGDSSRHMARQAHWSKPVVFVYGE